MLLCNWNCPDTITWACDVLAVRFPDRFCGSNAGQSLLKDRFDRHLIDGGVLLTLDDDDWRQLVPEIGPRKALMQALKVLMAKVCYRTDATPAAYTTRHDVYTMLKSFTAD